MVGNSSDGSASRVGAPGGVVGELEGTRPPVLGEVSEAELEAFVSKLRTDKNALIAPAEAPRSRWDRMAERLHRSGRRPLVSCVPEETARHAWYAVLGGKASGPHDVETLKARWEHGELGPDSLCWRDGFAAWVPVCQVPELAEALAPLPQEWLPETLAALDALDEVEIEEAPAADFVPTDVQALRSLAEDAPEPVTQVPLFVAHEVDPVGTHAVVPLPVVAAEAPEPAREKSRGRGVVWLALVGGVAGGVTVALVLVLLSSAAGRELLASVGGVAVVPAGANAAAAPGANGLPGAVGAGASGAGVGGANAATAPGVAGTVGANAATAPGVAGTVGASAASAPDFTGVAAVDRGGSVPVLTVAAGATAPSNVGPTAPPSTPLQTESLPQKAPGPRPKVPTAALALEKRTSEAPPAPEPLPAREPEEQAAAPAAEEDDLDLDLGPDENYERELAEPPAAVKAAREASKPTVFVPPNPGQPPVSLAQSEVFEVVLANKSDITACASAQPQKEGGRVVVRWSILPSGKVDDVVMETDSIKGTPLASCIEAKVRAWTFPKHQEQGAPVRFPFVF